MGDINFRFANQSDQELILDWHQKSHVRKFWDNSETQRNNVKSFLAGKKELYDYWLALLEDVPYALLMTSDAKDTPPDFWLPYLPRHGAALTIDFMIGAEEYVGKGLGAKTLRAFIDYLVAKDSNITTFIIDPAAHNERAVHVYQKAGFEIQESFAPKSGYFKDIEHYLMTYNIT